MVKEKLRIQFEEQRKHDEVDYESAYRHEFGYIGPVPNVEDRSVTLQQFNRVLTFVSDWATNSVGFKNSVSIGRMSFYHVNEWLVEPATVGYHARDPEEFAFAEALSQKPQPSHFFISHWWGERFLDCGRSLETHFRERGLPDDTGYWFWIFARRPHLPQESQRRCADPVISVSTGLIFIVSSKRDHNASICRLWCMFEFLAAISAKKNPPLLIDLVTCHGMGAQMLTDGLTDDERAMEEECPGDGTRHKLRRESSFPVVVMEDILQFDVETAGVSYDSEHRYILNEFAHRSPKLVPLVGHPNYACVNHVIRATMAILCWRHAVEKNVLKSSHLPQMVAADISRRTIELDLSLSLFDFRTSRSLANALHPHLRTLRLDCTDCESLEDSSMAMLASRLPQALTELQLCFASCTALTDSGLAAVSANFPKTLLKLSLNMSHCCQVGDGGLAALVNGVDDDTGTNRRIGGLPACLQDLDFDFCGCSEIGDQGLAALANGLPLGLQRARLSFAECQKISDLGFAALSRNSAVVLRSLRLDMRKCEHITSAGLATLGRTPQSIASFEGEEAESNGRRLVLHFALPRTVMTCDMANHRTTEVELNSVLSELGWGRLHGSEGWQLVFTEPSKETPDPTLCTYSDFLRRIYKDMNRIACKQAVFTNPGEPGEKLRHAFDKMVRAISYTSNWQLAKAYDIKKTNLNEDDTPEDPAEPEQAIMRYGRHLVLPSFWQLLVHLTKEIRNFSIVLRSFSTKQLLILQRCLHLFCKGVHPAYNGLNKTKLPPRMAGVKGRDLRLRPSGIAVLNRTHGYIKFNASVVSKDNVWKPDEDVHLGADSDPDEPDCHKNQHFRCVIPPYNNLYNGLLHNVLAKEATVAIIDDFAYWEKQGFQSHGGKLHIVDFNGCFAETQIQQLFFDGSIRNTDAHCVDVRDLHSSEQVAMQSADDVFIHRVDFYQACLDHDYFVKALEVCERKMTQQAQYLHGEVDAGTCLPLSEFELNLQECIDIGDGGVAALAKVLPKTLQILTINIGGNIRLTDAAISALAQGLPPGLQEFNLNVSRCPALGSEGIASLVQNMPENLVSLSLDLQRCHGVKDAAIIAIRQKLPKKLRRLNLLVQHTSVNKSLRNMCVSFERFMEWEPAPLNVQGVVPADAERPFVDVAAAARPVKPFVIENVSNERDRAGMAMRSIVSQKKNKCSENDVPRDDENQDFAAPAGEECADNSADVVSDNESRKEEGVGRMRRVFIGALISARMKKCADETRSSNAQVITKTKSRIRRAGRSTILSALVFQAGTAELATGDFYYRRNVGTMSSNKLLDLANLQTEQEILWKCRRMPSCPKLQKHLRTVQPPRCRRGVPTNIGKDSKLYRHIKLGERRSPSPLMLPPITNSQNTSQHSPRSAR